MSHVERSNSPRAVIHTRILDVAAERPDASLEEIAEEVSAATPALVDRVLEEYGDPGDSTPATDDHSHEPMSEELSSDATAQNGKDHPSGTGNATDGPTDSSTDGTTDSSTDSAVPADSVSMTDKQRETLVAVHERPEASQGEIADALDVTRATVSRRLNDIEGFRWDERAAFASAHLDSTGVSDATAPDAGAASEDERVAASEGTPGDAATVDPSAPAGVGALADRVAEIEDRLQVGVAGPGDADLDPELVHKVAHACMESDAISREEELQVLEHLMG